MNPSNGIILLDTARGRQNLIISEVKPEYLPHLEILGTSEFDDLEGILRTHRKQLIDFLQAHPQTVILTNYHFGVLPETWNFIRENQEKIINIFVVTCKKYYYETYLQDNDYPIGSQNIIDLNSSRKDNLRNALTQSY